MALLARLNDKSLILMWALFVLILPWMAGGRDAPAQLISFLAAGLGLFFAWRLPEPASVPRGPLAYLAAGLLSWAALSQIWSINRFQTFNWVVQLLLAYVAFVLARQLAGQLGRQRAWINGYLVMASIFSLYGFWLYLTTSYDRLTSSFFWPNPMAAYLLPAVILAVWYFAEEGRWRYLWPALITGAAFILTNSRSAYLLLGVVAVVALGPLRRRLPFWARLLGVVAWAFALAISFNLLRQRLQPTETIITPGSRFSDAVQSESVSRDDRLYYLKSTLAITRDYPVQGTGAGTYPSIHPHYQERVISAARHAHNFYAQTVAELGLVGAGLLAGLVLALLAGVIRGMRSGEVQLPLAVSAIALLVHFGLDIDTDYPALAMLAAATAGLVYRPVSKPAASGRTAGRLLLLMLWLLLPVVHRYQSALLDQQAELAQSDAEFAEAASLFQAAHGGLVYNPDSLLGEGINYYTLARMGTNAKVNYALAKERALNANQLDPWDAQHPFLLGRVLRASGDTAGAGAAYRRALELDPYNDPFYYSDPAEMYLEAGNLDEALRLAEAGLRHYPDSVIANRHQQPGIKRAVARLYVVRAVARSTRNQSAEALADVALAKTYDPANAKAAQLELQLRANSRR